VHLHSYQICYALLDSYNTELWHRDELESIIYEVMTFIPFSLGNVSSLRILYIHCRIGDDFDKYHSNNLLLEKVTLL